jgi:hypothetical protein
MRNVKQKHYPPAQDDARAAKRLRPFWDELAQPGYAGIDSRRRCGLVVLCPHDWQFIPPVKPVPPIKIWTQKFLDSLKADVTLDGGQTSVKKVWQPADALFSDTMLDNTCFYNPRAQYCHDSTFLDVTLDSGVYFGVIVWVGAGQDNFLMDEALDSGVYFGVVVPTLGMEDDFLSDVTCDSGVYTLVVVGSPAVQDNFIVDGTVDSGDYVQVIGATMNWEDKFIVDVSMDSGSYA